MERTQLRTRIGLDAIAIVALLAVAAPAAFGQQATQDPKSRGRPVAPATPPGLDEIDEPVRTPAVPTVQPRRPGEVGLNAFGDPFGMRRIEHVDGPGPPGVPDLGYIDPGYEEGSHVSTVYPRTRFATNGVSLRNASRGGINVVGVPPVSTVVKAYLYWAWASLAAPVPGLHDTMIIRRAFPTGGGPAVMVTGTLVGTGADPFWLGDFNWVYRVDLTLAAPTLVTGGGTYIVGIPPDAAGATDYTDPWGYPGPVAPLMEGASMVVIYENDVEPMGTTHLYDEGIAGEMFLSFPGLTYTLVGFVPPMFEARWANIGADGQTGLGYMDLLEVGQESTYELNYGTIIAGPGMGMAAPYADSDWNGSGNKPLGQLWDTSGHDVSAELIGLTMFPLLFTSPGIPGGFADALVPVANVLWTF